MKKQLKQFATGILGSLVCIFILSNSAAALGSQQNPQSGSLGLEATIPSTPPTSAATIAIPTNGQSFSAIPVTVGGLCPSNLLIKIFSNNVFIGSAVCGGGSYSLKVDLFSGTNKLTAQDFDALGQSGPVSNTVQVTYTSAEYAQPGSQVTVTSNYAELGANPRQTLDWPIIINGGTPPYAISTDWGDGQSPTLASSAFSGETTLKHIYSTAGVYTVTVTVTDNNGNSGFLQLVGVANGQIIPAAANGSSSSKSQSPSTKSGIPWWPFLLVAVALIPAFWLGNRHGKTVLLRKYQ